MEFYLQFGHGMMEHCCHLIRKWGQGTVILSPRDLSVKQLSSFPQEISKIGGKTLLDPQFYDPRGDHHGLVKHKYWPEKFNTSVFMKGAGLKSLLEELMELNKKAMTSDFILPGLYCKRVNDDWLAIQKAIVEESGSIVKSGKDKISTICLSGESLRYDEDVEMLINASEEWDVNGYYIVPEHPRGAYLADEPIWLSNLLGLCAGLKLQKRKVYVGYSGHQMLCLACADVDVIAAGTWLNVRSFTTNKFQEPDTDSTSRRATWYYCPQTLSEYKIPFLDMAFRKSVLSSLATPFSYGSDYADVLFSGAQPSTTDYSEQQSFRHYLSSLHHQCVLSRKGSFLDTVSFHQTMLNDTEGMIRIAQNAGVRGQGRDFLEFIDVNRSAIDAFVESRGFVLKRIWK